MKLRILTIATFVMLIIVALLIVFYVAFKKYNELQISEASQSGNFKEMALLILRTKENIDKVDKYGFTPIMHAANIGDYASFRFLLSMQADITVITEDGDNLVLLAAGSKQKNSQNNFNDKNRVLIIDILISRGMNINSRSSIGRTPLAYASEHGYIETVYYLLNKNPNINNVDKVGNTALSLAIKNEHSNISRMLLERGALLSVIQ